MRTTGEFDVVSAFIVAFIVIGLILTLGLFGMLMYEVFRDNTANSEHRKNAVSECAQYCSNAAGFEVDRVDRCSCVYYNKDRTP